MRQPPVHSSTGLGREEVMKRGGGEEARRVWAVCDKCATHGDKAAVGFDVDTQGSSLREHATHFFGP